MSETAVEIGERALAAAAGDEAEVLVHSERSGLARFAASEVHQPTLIENVIVELTVVRDGRAGIARTNRLSQEGLTELARRAGAAADAASSDPDRPGLAPPPPAYPEVEAEDEETAALGSDDQARLASAAIGAAGEFGLYGFFTSAAVELAIASTTGLRAQQRFTDATVLALAAGDDESGYAERTSWRVSALDPAAVAREAAAKAARTGGAVELEPGRYAAVLEPYAVADLLRSFAVDAFNASALLDGRSYLTGRLGERVFGEQVSIADDPLDPAGLPKAFDFEGTPKRRVELVEAGVARGVVWDRLTAARAGNGAQTTGHALPSSSRRAGAIPLNLTMAPGEEESTEALAALVGEGVYVTRVDYVNIVDPRAGILTGMTRDGTFRIRGGRIAEPLVNLRVTVSMPELLSEVLGLTREQTLSGQAEFYGERYPVGSLVPGLATARFNVVGTGSRPGL